MKKTEMEAHHARYQAAIDQARSARMRGRYQQAIELALTSWDHIDGMMQYERKYGSREFSGIEAIDMVLEYAPVLFHLSSLDALESLLKSQRRIEKNTSAVLADKLASARAIMWEAHRMWDHLERNPHCRQDQLRTRLGGDQHAWRTLAETWDEMGLIKRTSSGGSYRLELTTQMSDVVLAKCPSCGIVAKAAKRRFLDGLACPKCRRTVLFVIFSEAPRAAPKE